MIARTRVETIGRCFPPERRKFCVVFYSVDGYRRAQIPSWSLFPLVQNLCALRGRAMIAAAGLAAAIGDPSRFATAPHFTACLGMVPSEHTSGPKRRIGGITKAGDIHA